MNEKKKWIPPEDMADIPEKILLQIPEEYCYWMAESPEKLRIALMEAIEKEEVVIDTSVELSAKELEKVYLKEKIELVKLMQKRWRM